ncbi:MAG TPA: antibiotic biosynthesis monooxygenase [Anaerolineaceae bacterium]|mgnify:CR=1 FL=1|nr:antibiotic biosynthesis monooxygenase [Anaerolineaceae bacterium]HPN50587.1 antibiotic biosynthesis monooxygenase [Anaerolineaceae bacterium]
MHIVMVYAHVKPEYVDTFLQASLENARHSLQEPGIARFDVLQEDDDPTRFVLFEVYQTADDPALHRETAHYKTWKSTVEPMMAEARTKTIYHNIFPEDKKWGQA